MTSITGFDPEDGNYGIEEAQEYSLIAAVELSFSMSNKQRLVLIRNPRGHKEWSGEWSSRSIKWQQFPTAKDMIKTILDKRGPSIDLEDPTCFWMSFDDFLRYFRLTNVCYVENHCSV